MRKILCICFIFLASPLAGSQLPAGFVEKLIAQNLDPTDMVIAPDGRIFITIKSGKILIVENGVLSSSVLLTLSVDNFNERGLGHIALDPNFNTNNFYYIYYTVPNAGFNRVSRFTANGNSNLPGSEVVLLDLDLFSGSIHNAGDMVFGVDGKLYITTGDGANPANSQSLATTLGKILRINRDGSIPTDNPFFNSTSGKSRSIWALGLRNPFSLDIQPGTGKLLVSDVGQANWEEINEIQAGKNYGWPGIEGPRTTQTPPANYQDPLFVYPHGTGNDKGCAIIGAAFYNPTVAQFPSQYFGKFFFADYCNGYMKYLDPLAGTAQIFATGINRPLAMVVAPDGSLYYLARAGLGGGSEQDNTTTPNGTLWKVEYTGSGAPTISAQPESITAAVGDVVTFTISASGQQPLSYQWMVDGVPIPNATSSSYMFTVTQLSDNGKNFRCQVSNGLGGVSTNNALLTVTSNTRPIPLVTVLLPGGNTLYQAGQTLQFSGSATDAEDGTIAISAFSWKIDFHHDQHTHPGLAPTVGLGSGFYTIPKVGELTDNVWYRVILSVTDSQGLANSTYKDVFPQKVTIGLNTSPLGLNLIVDGQTLQTPAFVQSVVGISRTIEAPVTQTLNNSLFSFANWTESGLSRFVSFDAPSIDKNFSANYSQVKTGNGQGLLASYRNTFNANTTQQSSLDGPIVLSKVDPQINFDWGLASPGSPVNIDYFTAVWDGEVQPQFSELYTFYVNSDDGSRLWVNDILLVNKWIPQASTEWSGTIALEADTKYKIRVEYFELAGQAIAKLLWSSLRTPKQPIPKSQLYATPITAIEPNLQSEYSLYPQPASEELFIALPLGAILTDRKYVIFDSVGKLVAIQHLDDAKSAIDVRQLNPGIYFLRMGNWTTKFSKR